VHLLLGALPAASNFPLKFRLLALLVSFIGVEHVPSPVWMQCENAARQFSLEELTLWEKLTLQQEGHCCLRWRQIFAARNESDSTGNSSNSNNNSSSSSSSEAAVTKFLRTLQQLPQGHLLSQRTLSSIHHSTWLMQPYLDASQRHEKDEKDPVHTPMDERDPWIRAFFMGSSSLVAGQATACQQHWKQWYSACVEDTLPSSSYWTVLLQHLLPSASTMGRNLFLFPLLSRLVATWQGTALHAERLYGLGKYARYIDLRQAQAMLYMLLLVEALQWKRKRKNQNQNQNQNQNESQSQSVRERGCRELLLQAPLWGLTLLLQCFFWGEEDMPEENTNTPFPMAEPDSWCQEVHAFLAERIVPFVGVAAQVSQSFPIGAFRSFVPPGWLQPIHRSSCQLEGGRSEQVALLSANVPSASYPPWTQTAEAVSYWQMKTEQCGKGMGGEVLREMQGYLHDLVQDSLPTKAGLQLAVTFLQHWQQDGMEEVFWKAINVQAICHGWLQYLQEIRETSSSDAFVLSPLKLQSIWKGILMHAWPLPPLHVMGESLLTALFSATPRSKATQHLSDTLRWWCQQCPPTWWIPLLSRGFFYHWSKIDTLTNVEIFLEIMEGNEGWNICWLEYVLPQWISSSLHPASETLLSCAVNHFSQRMLSKIDINNDATESPIPISISIPWWLRDYHYFRAMDSSVPLRRWHWDCVASNYVSVWSQSKLFRQGGCQRTCAHSASSSTQCGLTFVHWFVFSASETSLASLYQWESALVEQVQSANNALVVAACISNFLTALDGDPRLGTIAVRVPVFCDILRNALLESVDRFGLAWLETWIIAAPVSLGALYWCWPSQSRLLSSLRTHPDQSLFLAAQHLLRVRNNRLGNPNRQGAFAQQESDWLQLLLLLQQALES
jgi:hypothetical protein